MNWIQKLAAFFAATNMILAPVFAQAQTTQSLSPQDQTKLNEYQDFLKPLGYHLQVDSSKDEATVYDNTTNEKVMEIPFGQEDELRKYSPENMNAKMLEEMMKAKSVKGASSMAWSQSMQHLPTESAIFFMAMGAVVAGQLITNYAQNPLGMKQHIDSQLSLVGVASFFTFMYSQGVTSNVLQMYLTNPKYARFIPYLGMVVGSVMQSYFSQVASDPNVIACAGTMMGVKISDADKAAGVEADPCGKAYDYLVVHKKIWDMTPGIISMLASSALAGGVEIIGGATVRGAGRVVGKAVGGPASIAARFAGRIAQRAIMRMVGVDIATLITPGGIEVKGLRLLLTKGLQLGLFVWIDGMLSSKVNYAWKNIFDGSEFNNLNNKLVNDVVAQKKAGWNADPSALAEDVKDLRAKSSAWHMVNLSDVYEAHQNWSMMLQQLTGMFNASYGYYTAFTNAVDDAKSGNATKPLNRAYPLNGVIAKDLADGKQDLYFTNPKFIQPMQEDTVTDVAAYIYQSMTDGTYAKLGMLPLERKTLQDIHDLLSQDDDLQKGAGLQKLNAAIDQCVQTNVFSADYLQELRNIYSQLGAPNPLMEAGRGFNDTYEKAPSTSSTVKGVNYYRVVGMFQTDRITDDLLMQMICGPDAEKGESSVRVTSGFPAVFLSPQIKNPGDDLSNYCYGSGELPASDIYSHNLQVAGGKTYKGVIDYLKSNVRPSISDDSGNHMTDWWEKNTTNQMQAAFLKFGAKYDQIVADMIREIYTTSNSSLNGGPMANGTITSLFQEARVYQMILGEILKDQYQSQKGTALPPQYLAKEQEPAVVYTPAQARATTVPLLSMLAQSPTMEFNRLVQPFYNTSARAAGKAPQGHALQAQADLEKEFATLNGLLKHIKVVQVQDDSSWLGSAKTMVGLGNTHDAIQSDLENSQLEDQLKKIQAVLSQFAGLLGVAQTKDGAPQAAPALVSLNPALAQLSVSCVENLQAIAMEMMMYGTIANAVSWDKIRNLNSINLEQQKFNNQVQKQMNTMRSLAMPGSR